MVQQVHRSVMVSECKRGAYDEMHKSINCLCYVFVIAGSCHIAKVLHIQEVSALTEADATTTSEGAQDNLAITNA